MFSRIASLFSDIPMFLLRIPVVLIALSVHECMHAVAAWKLGDPTARNLGRATINPLKHLDPVGALLLLFCGFGWARPVPVTTRNFRHPRRDMALTALAGPVSNLCLALIGCLFYHIEYTILEAQGLIRGIYIYTESGFAANLVNYSLQFFSLFMILNIGLGVFNLLPIPPLDGSRLITLILPPRAYYAVMQYERYIAIVLMLLLVCTDILTTPLGFLISWTTKGMDYLITLIPFLH